MNIKMRYLTIIAVGMLMTAGTAAADDDKTTIIGAGMISCGKFLEDKEQFANLLEGNYFSWVQGFMSAMNTFFADPETYVDLSDVAGQKLWLENYCQQNPLDKYYVATVELWRERQNLQLK